ncbi:MAG: DotU family type IV/VI secretion system protein [Smithella sp.]
MRLVDCLIELITFTAYLIENLHLTHPSYEGTRKKYEYLLNQAENCRKENGFSDKDWNDALFAVCAWIDEIILCSDWKERANWQRSQLQRIYFNTSNAGEEFFQRLSQCAEDNKPVREVYEHCLSLGFKGLLFQPEDQEHLTLIKNKNLELVMENANGMPSEDLFPDAYSTVVNAGKSKIWTRFTNVFNLFILVLPVLAFGALYYLYKFVLDEIIISYLK